MTVREIEKSDLIGLLELYTELHENTVPEHDSELEELWDEILNDKNHHIIVVEEDGKIASS